MAYVAILGVSGYSGQETLDRVLGHPELDVVALGSDSMTGRPVTDVDVRLGRGPWQLPDLVSNAEALHSGADVIFVCLDHEKAAALDVPGQGIVVDLSGGHRLQDVSGYEDWYGFIHPRPGGLSHWSYAIPELSPPAGRLVANPGCYATAALLALLPLRDAVDPDNVVVDAKSGVTGAGRSLRPSSHAGQVLENLTPYKVGNHQHLPEMTQALGFAVTFVPHLLPVRRGLMATCYLRSATSDLRERIEAAYEKTPAVTVLPPDQVPELSRVHKTDAAEIGVFQDRATGKTVVITALDNLGKGAAGQAIQNANYLLGYPDDTGLRLHGVPS